ncbi:MAG: hypothetical protein K2L16_09900 [Muribaculaceae bacterium]|nr:hypothetical protein [Muribaculaceae bacterium]
MATQNKKNSGLWAWIVVALIVAAIVVGTLFYIGWFNTNTHVDSLNGDNVTEQYKITEPGADQPGEADWQNADHESLDEIITRPEATQGE